MRERLTAAFVLLSILLLLGAVAVRTPVLRDLMREQAGDQLHQQAVLIATMVDDRNADGGAVDRAFFQGLVGDEDRLVFDDGGSAPIVVTGDDYDASDSDVSATAATSDGAMVTVAESAAALRDVLGRDLGSILALFLLFVVAAGVAGFLTATVLSAPFQRLAVAAGALGRGRFDLDLPQSRVPEARAIADALRSSALQLEDRLHRERDVTQHLSHVLRTPLTGMRLCLEELALRDDLPGDVQEAIARSLTRVQAMDAVVGDLVDLTRSGTLVAGAELPLRDLATQLAQRWADRLDGRHRGLTAAAEGDLELAFTPGPVEHVTDLLLADVVRRGGGAVRLVLHGEPGGHLRIEVHAESRAVEVGEEHLDRISQVRGLVEALGGRVTGEHPADGVEVLLPRR